MKMQDDTVTIMTTQWLLPPEPNENTQLHRRSQIETPSFTAEPFHFLSVRWPAMFQQETPHMGCHLICRLDKDRVFQVWQDHQL